jgi:hypothetical protein
MKDYEYEEENLDDFMINAAKILSDKSNPERNSIIESLKQHLSSIFHNESEMENFFRTLNGVIYTSEPKENSSNNGQMIDNKEPFILYPLIFSFNPKTTSYYFDYYLQSLDQCLCEENRPDFTFLSEVFADVVTAFFSDENNNKNLIKPSYLLEQLKKYNLYEKILNFCNNKIQTNKKLEQSFGCLLLTELIEKCPMVKEAKNLDDLFKLISEYLDDRWFECKLDLLNCTISLIFAAETKFKPYANVCLFRVLDYLTDMDWMKRKLAINIVYTLVFYCKDEIMAVKENIIEFLNMLKEDSIDEVREVCMHTLKFLDEGDENEEEEIPEIRYPNEKDKPKNVFNKYGLKKNQKNKINRSNYLDNNDAKSTRSAKSNKSNKTKKSGKNELLRYKKNPNLARLDRIEKDFMERRKNNKSYSGNKSNASNTSTYRNNTLNTEKPKPKPIEPPKEPQIDNTQKIADELNESINTIMEQLQKIQEDQAEFRQMLTNLKQTAGNNYLNLNERIRELEKNRPLRNNNRNPRDDYNDSKVNREKKNKQNNALNTSEELIKIEDLKTLFNSGKYNEALLECYQNDRYLLKLIPLIDRKIIPKIEIALLEDAITRVNKRIPVLCMEGDRDDINEILLFYIQILKARIDLKLVMQLSIKDALNYLKTNGNNILNEDDINNIDKILNYLKAKEYQEY